jgi:hypothetical protein
MLVLLLQVMMTVSRKYCCCKCDCWVAAVRVAEALGLPSPVGILETKKDWSPQMRLRGEFCPAVST